MNRSTKQIKDRPDGKNFLYLDINSFPHEGFTSGLFITLREILKRIIKHGHQAKIASVAEDAKKRGISFGENQGIATETAYLESMATNVEDTRSTIQHLIMRNSPDVILMNTPAVIFNEAHIAAIENAVKTQRQVVVMVVDELFPTETDHPKDMVDRYYGLLRSDNVEILGLPNRIRERFEVVSGKKSDRLPQLFDFDSVIAQGRNGRYITQVNTHPIKGIGVFDEIAKRMPEKEFLAVESWVDTPQYTPPSSNVILSPMFQNPKDLYERTRILLVPSLCPEGASRVAIEAMLNGIPVIAHRIGSLPEIDTGQMHFVDPPNITGYTMDGSIMYPVIEDNELQSVSQRCSNFTHLGHCS